MGELEEKEKMMTYVEQCPRCGGAVVEKEVKEVLYGGKHTAFLQVKVGVCLHCGERLYTPETVRRFEEIEVKLAQQETADFQPLGTSFQVVS
jgi:YgiT-type zinc finger domain-containing protein